MVQAKSDGRALEIGERQGDKNENQEQLDDVRRRLKEVRRISAAKNR